MAQGVVADNWSLQDISTLLTTGLDADHANEVVIENGTHSYRSISGAAIQTEALFDFVTDLVLRDEILVEEEFTHVWEQHQSPILAAKELGVVRSIPFLSDPKKISGPRERIVEHICSTNSLKIAHQINVDGWNSNRITPDPLLSATLWGGAGMCARSFVYEKSYTPHPLRKRLFINSGFMLPAGDALHQLTTFLDDNTIKVSKKIYGTDSLYSMYLNLPAIPIRIIQESSSPDQFVLIALEMRKEFQELREWLKRFQNAMAEDDVSLILRYRKELDSVSQYVSKKIGVGSTNSSVSMEAGIGIFKLILQGNPLETIKNQFGIRATLNKLIFGGNGKAEIAKYIKMFGAQGSTIGYEVERHFSNKAKP